MTKYVEILAWPATVLVGMLLFAGGINQILGGSVELEAFGVTFKGSARKVEAELRTKVNELAQGSSDLARQVKQLKEINAKLVGQYMKLAASAQTCKQVPQVSLRESKQLLAQSTSISDSVDQKASYVQQVANSSKYQQASELEKAGFEALLRSEYRAAAAKFLEANRIYPEYHNVYEIYNLINQNLSKLEDPRSEVQTRRELLTRILDQLSWGMPSDIRLKIKNELEHTDKTR